MSILPVATKVSIFFRPLVLEQEMVIGLSVTVGLFLILLLLGIRNTYKLKAENKRLSELYCEEKEDKENKYKDFTEGHLYSNN